MAGLPPITDAVWQLRRSLEEIQALAVRNESSADLYSRLKSAGDTCLARLSALEIWGPDNRLPSSELWNVAGHLLALGWLQNRARAKPRGYAGDHEMLACIYENRLCDDPLGRLCDRYFQEQAAPQAVRNRMLMIADWIVAAARRDPHPPERSPRIAIVGSAFGLEVRDALLRLDQAARGRLRLALLDVDPEAIAFARQNLEPLLRPEQLTAVSTNLFRLPDRPATTALLSDSALIICPGLLDYLDDGQATAMLRCLYDRLTPNGKLVVFQFAPQNPTRAYMEWFGNWYLTYRDAVALRRLVESAGLPGATVVYGAEPLGVDLFASIERR